MQDVPVDQAELARREEERDPCEIAASLYVVPKVRIPCVIKDLSPNGAKLKIAPEIDLPKHIFLVMPVIDDVTETRHCELRWRIDDVVGLKFVKLSRETIERLKAEQTRPAVLTVDTAASRKHKKNDESREYRRLQADTHFRDLLSNRGK